MKFLLKIGARLGIEHIKSIFDVQETLPKEIGRWNVLCPKALGVRTEA